MGPPGLGSVVRAPWGTIWTANTESQKKLAWVASWQHDAWEKKTVGQPVPVGFFLAG